MCRLLTLNLAALPLVRAQGLLLPTSSGSAALRELLWDFVGNVGDSGKAGVQLPERENWAGCYS